MFKLEKTMAQQTFFWRNTKIICIWFVFQLYHIYKFIIFKGSYEILRYKFISLYKIWYKLNAVFFRDDRLDIAAWISFMFRYLVYYKNVKKYARNLWDMRSVYKILFFIWNNIRMWIDIVIRIEAKGFESDDVSFILLILIKKDLL
jgi:hypothetical protein